jgi:hypothetical protein
MTQSGSSTPRIRSSALRQAGIFLAITYVLALTIALCSGSAR